jgi:hypothetical protein
LSVLAAALRIAAIVTFLVVLFLCCLPILEDFALTKRTGKPAQVSRS